MVPRDGANVEDADRSAGADVVVVQEREQPLVALSSLGDAAEDDLGVRFHPC